MGNQIAIDLGPVYLEASIFIAGEPVQEYTTYYIYSAKHNGTFYFIRLLKAELESFKSHPLYAKLTRDDIPVQITGVKFDDFHLRLAEMFNIQVVDSEKTKFAVKALNFFWNNSKESLYQYKNTQVPPSDGSICTSGDFVKEAISEEVLFPCLLVNVRSGISIYRVNSLEDFHKVGGSSFGGSTFWALSKLLCKFETPTDALESSRDGDNVLVDMTVGDIYGRGYDQMGLPHNLIASSCAKLREKRRDETDPASIAKSLLVLFCFNMTQIAYMQSVVEGIDRIAVVGDAMHCSYANELAQYCIDFWSANKIKLIQSDYGAYFGSFGALLRQLDRV